MKELKTYPTPTIPVAWGELIDKITVLEIKAAKIKSAAALVNVKKELSQLLRIVKNEASIEHVIGELKLSLKFLNEQLWAVEDSIREKEEKQEFDQAFIDLARSVYHLNDKRAQINSCINQRTLSEIVEEKSYKGLKTS